MAAIRFKISEDRSNSFIANCQVEFGPGQLTDLRQLQNRLAAAPELATLYREREDFGSFAGQTQSAAKGEEVVSA